MPSRLFTQILIVVLFSYCLSIGATYNGLLHPEFGLLTLVVMAVLVAVWLYARWGWRWHRTCLDRVILLWILSFTLSLLTNLDAGRRILMGLWYMGLYIGVWYVLQDIIANRPHFREFLVHGLIVAGVVVLAYGYVQVLAWVVKVIQSGAGIVNVERPVSTFGNPNFLGSFLVILIPYVLVQTVDARSRLQRLALMVYLTLAVILLLLAFSRGAWLGAGAVAMVWVLWFLFQRQSFRPQRFPDWWFHQSGIRQIVTVVIGLLTALVALSVGMIFVSSLSDPTRSADARTEIYQGALQLFVEKPITGQGLFTFGRGLVRLPDVHPVPHSHAHNLVLHIAAELGVVGLGVLVMTVVVIARALWHNLKISQGQDQVLLVGAIAATVGFAVHQLFDVTAMMPVIMLSGLLTLAVGLASASPQVVQIKPVYPLAMAALWLILFVSGLWSNRIYANYAAIITEVGRTGFYRRGAERLQPVIDSDPLSLYRLQQAFLFGMAASIGDRDAARQGVAAYQQFLELEPGYAFAWGNLAALHWQLDERDQAVAAMQEAERLDSDIWQYAADLALYYDDMGLEIESHAAYQRALRLNPDARLYTELSKFSTDGSPEMSIRTQVGLLLTSGDTQAAVQLWSQNHLPETVMNDVVQAILFITQSDLSQAQLWLARAGQIARERSDRPWLHLGWAKLAEARGEYDVMAHELENARRSVVRAALENDEIDLLNISYAELLRLPIPRQYLPQVFYPVDDAILLYWLERN